MYCYFQGVYINQRKPFIFDIKRGSFDDGPGIRSVVFFKGCPLHCSWCHNPESIDPDTQIAFSPVSCIRCGKCRSVCPVRAIDPEAADIIDRSLCTRCGKCAVICPSASLRKIGEHYTPDELCAILLKDLDYYQQSGGGISVSGGEPFLFPEYTGCVLEKLKIRGLHVLAETCGYFNVDRFREKLLPYIDMIYFDLKLIDPQSHRKHTGQSNKIIISNFYRLIKESRIKVIPRIPLIPFVTTTEENLAGITRLLKDSGCVEYILLPYNSGGISKAESIGEASRLPVIDPEIMLAEERKSIAIFTELMRR